MVGWHNTRLHMGLLHVRHVVGVVAMLDLLWVDIHSLLSRRERCLWGLRVWPWGHRRWCGCQGRIHLLLWRLVSQVEGLGCCCCCCCCLRVLWVLDWAGSWMARRASMLWSTLLCLACRRGRGLRVLRVRVQGGTRVGVLLRHWPWRHIHGVCLLWVLCSRGRDETGLAMRGRRHHPGTALHHWTEHMLCL